MRRQILEEFYLSCFLMSLLCRDELSLRVRFGKKKKDLVTEQLDSSLILILVSETCICFDVFTNSHFYTALFKEIYY